MPGVDGKPHVRAEQGAPTAWLTTLVLLAAMLLAGSASARTRPRPASSPLTIAATGHLATGGQEVTVSGRLTCAKGEHVRVSLWLFERSRGALAKGSEPAGSTASAGSPAKAKTGPFVCLGSPQPWSITATATGKHPAGLGRGPAEVCATMITNQKYLYTDLKQACQTVLLV